jgi:hypothetical protein
MVGLALCSPNTTEIIPLMPTFPSNSETDLNKIQSLETIKQDNEYKAASRLIGNLDTRILKLNPIFLGDALYATVPFIELVHKNNNSNFIFTCKPGKNNL